MTRPRNTSAGAASPGIRDGNYQAIADEGEGDRLCLYSQKLEVLEEVALQAGHDLRRTSERLRDLDSEFAVRRLLQHVTQVNILRG